MSCSKGSRVDKYQWPNRSQVSEVILWSVIVTLSVGYLHAQVPEIPQTGINAVFDERLKSFALRLDSIENMLRYGMVAMFGNVLAHLLQIRWKGGKG